MQQLLFVWGFVVAALSANACSGESQRAPSREPRDTEQAPPQPSAPAPSPPPPAPKAPTPTRPDPAAQLRQGAELYGRMCAVCHGAAGEGYKADRAPALAQQDFLASVTDDFLGVAIADGRKGTNMSAWFVGRGGPLSVAEINALIAFIRSWQKAPAAVLDERPATGDSARGQALFTRHCERCHGPKGPSVRIRARELLSTASTGFLRHAIRGGRPPTEMQSFASTLHDQGVEDVVAYLRSLPSWPTPEQPTSRPPPIPLGPVPLNPAGAEPRGFQTYPKMTPVDVVQGQLRLNRRMVLLDARVPTDFTQIHIAGAVSVPFYDPSPYLAALPKDAWFVAYCACPHAESGALADKLVNSGFRKVTVLEEGLNVWIDRGYPTGVGMQP